MEDMATSKADEGFTFWMFLKKISSDIRANLDGMVHTVGFEGGMTTAALPLPET